MRPFLGKGFELGKIDVNPANQKRGVIASCLYMLWVGSFISIVSPAI